MSQRPESPSPLPSLPINPGYVLGQLARALTTSQHHESAEVRERAAQDVERWQRIFQGLLGGFLQVGSRTPVPEVPAWATLRVITGGFATGELLAEGPLAPHERQWLRELDALSAPNPRAVLNAYFLSEPGQAVLGEMLATGAYRLDVPEEGALLVVTWLLRHDEAEQARALPEGACQHFPNGWHERARHLRAEIVTARQQHPTFQWTHKPTSNFGKLFTALESCVDLFKRVTPGQRRQVEHVLDAISQSRGLPESERARHLRTQQERIASLPTPDQVARVLIERLQGRAATEGLASLEEVAGTLTEQESARHRVPAGTRIPPALERKLRRCVEGSLEQLVELGMVTSSEVLAQVLPQVSSHVSALGITDPELRRLYGHLYAAFRRRRSLLLLDLQSQVKLQELPWVRVLESHRTTSLGQQEVARQTLERITTLAVTAFPESILPNKLLQELRALAQARDGTGSCPGP